METSRKRKNYPGDMREPGTKDYAVIMGNLMGYRNQLIRSTDEQEIGNILLKSAEKLKELGFLGACEKLKKKAGRRKLGMFEGISLVKRDLAVESISKNWEKAKIKHDKAKNILKETSKT